MGHTNNMWLYLILGFVFLFLIMLVFVPHVISYELDLDTWSIQLYVKRFMISRIRIYKKSVYQIIAKKIRKEKQKRKKRNRHGSLEGIKNKLNLRIDLRLTIPSKSLDILFSAQLATIFYIMDTYNKISTNKIIPHYYYTFDTFAIDGIISFRIWDIIKAKTSYAIARMRKRYAQ